MQQVIKTISLPLPFRMGRVNCYLIQTGVGYLLIDTGNSNCRKELVRELESAGCKPGLLNLIVLTHGDFDHSGNAAYLRGAFSSKIAMHNDDLSMVERGDMFVNRKEPNILLKKMLPIFFGFGISERFKPDLFLEDGTDLSEYGMDARIVSILGHSKGSIGVLTADGDLFCGDLLVNTGKPALNSLIDDFTAANASIQKLGRLRIDKVYPGHGSPFPMRSMMVGSP